MTRSGLVLGLLLASCTARPGVDRVVVGKIWTGDRSNPEAQALAIAGDSIVAVGDSALILKLAGTATERLDAGGGLILPAADLGRATVRVTMMDGEVVYRAP